MDILQEKGESSETVGFIKENLQSINHQLTALHLQIYQVKTKLNSCTDSGPTYDAMMAEEKAAREKFISLQKEVTELLDRFNHRNTLLDKHKSTTAAIAYMYQQQNSLLVKRQHLMQKINGRGLEDRITQLEEQCTAARREEMGLRERLGALQQEVNLETEMEERFQNNEAMRSRIQQLKARREHIIQKTVVLQNDNLQSGIEELNREILSETTFKKLFHNMEISEKTLVQQNMTMQQKHQDLKRKHNDLRVWGERCSERSERMAALKTQNEDLIKQCHHMETQIQLGETFKHKYEELESEQKILLAQSGMLKKRHSKLLKKLESLEDWQKKYDVLKAETEALKEENNRASEQIQEIQLNLGKLSDFKAEFKSLQAEKKVLQQRKSTLQKEVEQLEKILSKERAQEAKNNAMVQENEALRRQTCQLHVQAERLRNSLHGKDLLSIIHDSLKEEKDGIRRQNELIRKEVQKLEKTRRKESALKGKYTAMMPETENDIRQVPVLHHNRARHFWTRPPPST